MNYKIVCRKCKLETFFSLKKKFKFMSDLRRFVIKSGLIDEHNDFIVIVLK